MTRKQGQKLRVILGLLFTIATIHFVPNRPPVLILLLVCWAILFYPFQAAELILFALAALFFLFQNYVCLKAGLFEFKFKDILLMPYYEPVLWGFYYMCLKRFISDERMDDLLVDKKSIAALGATSIMFSLFSFDSRALFLATACSTAFLLFLFHTKDDLSWVLHALALGFILEQFGVSTGLWWYPAPDFLGLPYWFVTMWISVGLLGRRFAIPAAEYVAGRIERQRA